MHRAVSDSSLALSHVSDSDSQLAEAEADEYLDEVYNQQQTATAQQSINNSQISARFDSLLPLSAFSLSPDRQLLVLGGKEVKILSFAAGSFHFLKHLNTYAKSFTTAVSDVQWHPMESSKQLIATAPTNGKIVIYNLSKDGLKRPDRLLEDHERTVNRLAWHPTDSAILLSGSQDGSVKLWDLRIGPSAGKSACAISLNDAISVRDVQPNPFASNLIAAAYENGCIQLWDSRKPTQSISTINGHQGLILALDWHPLDKDILASGGVDRSIHVWDINASRESLHTIQTIASVGRIKWRPHRSYQIASAASLMDFKVHVWNLQSPFVPMATCVGHKDVATGIIWSDNGDSILSCSKDNCVQIHPMNPKLNQNVESSSSNPVSVIYPIEHFRTVSLDWSVRGELSSVSDSIDRRPVTALRDPIAPAFQFTAPPQSHLWNKDLFDRKQHAVVEIHSEFAQNTETFLQLADRCIWHAPGGLSEVCERNCALASELGQIELAQVWKIIGTCFENATPKFLEASKETAEGIPMLPKELLGIEESDSPMVSNIINNKPIPIPSSPSDYLVYSLPENISSPIDASLLLDSLPKVHLSHAFINQNSPVPNRPAVHENLDFQTTLVIDLLDSLSDSGDVQTCVLICLALKSYVFIEESRQRQWFFYYIDLLLRHRQFSTAATIIPMSNDAEIRQMNSKSTTFALACGHCRHSSTQTGCRCQDCKQFLNSCAICQMPVHGVFVWCQGCGHGGHVDHLTEWFDKFPFCPTGCLHRCTIETRNTGNVNSTASTSVAAHVPALNQSQ